MIGKPTTWRQAWSIATPLAHGEMKARLDAAFGTPWKWGDSAIHGDYLGGQVTPEAIVRIYEAGDRFVVELRFHSATVGAADRLVLAKAMTVEKLLPVIEAKDVRDSETMD